MTGCSTCDWFVPVSLLLPLAILVMVAITGIMATTDASRRKAGSAWPPALGVLTAIGVIGPVAALAIFRDSPDVLVPVATVLLVILPVATIGYVLTTGRRA